MDEARTPDRTRGADGADGGDGGTETGGTDAALDAADYYDQRLVVDVAVSPGGDRLAFVAVESDGAEEESLTSLFVVPTDGSRDPHRLTRLPGVSSPAWGPDGSKLGFLAGREEDVELRAAKDPDSEDDDGDGDGEGAADAEDEGEDADEGDDADGGDDAEDDNGEEKPQLWVFDLELGGDARQVTTRSEGVKEFDWAPDGERVVVSSRDPTDEEQAYLDEREDDGPIEVERLQHKAEGAGWLDEVTTYLFVVDVGSREERRLDDAYAGGSLAARMHDRLVPDWGPDDRIAFVANQDEDADDSDALDLFTVGADGEDLRKLTDGTVAATGPTWSPDGEYLAYGVGDPENTHVPDDVHVRGPDGEETVLTDDLDRDVGYVAWVGDDTLLATVGDEGRTSLLAFDRDGGRRDALPGQDDATGVFPYAADVDADSGTAGVIVTGASDWYPAALDVTGDDGLRKVADPNRDLMDRVEVGFERVTYESDPDVTVEAMVKYPGDVDIADPGERLPVVVDIHGGPTTYDEPRYAFRHHYWVSRGYVVCQPNYRGSSSYGRAFSEAIRGEWGPREARDVAAGVDHLVDRGLVDPDRVFVTGFSQGGINTAYVLAHTDVATAGAAQHGIYDAASAFGTDDSHNWWENDFGTPWDDPEAYRAASSVAMADEIDAPLLLTAGENDWRCPPTQAEQLYVAVKKCGTDAKLVVYPNLGHDWGTPDVATHRLETITGWFREHDPAVTDSDADGESDGSENDAGGTDDQAADE